MMFKRFGKIWGNSFYQGGVLLTISSFIINLLNYAFNLLTGRILGPSGYGEIVTLFSYMVIFSVPISILSTMVTQKVGSKDERRFIFARQLEIWLIEKMKRRWFIFLILLFIVPFLPRITNLSPLSAYLLVPLIIFSFGATFYSASLQGLRMFLAISIIGVLAILIKLLGPATASINPNGTFIILIFLLLSNFFNYYSAQFIFHKAVAHTSHLKGRIEKSLRSAITSPKSLVTIAAILGIVLINNADIIFVKKFFTSHDAGLYGAWNLLAKVVFYSIGPLVSISLVYFSSKKNKDMQRKVFLIALIIFAFVGMVSYVFYTYYGSFVINLFFGSKFESIQPYLSQASNVGSLYTIIVFICNYYIAKESKINLILPIGVVAYICSLFFIPKTLIGVIQLNVMFNVVIVMVYFIASLALMLYNRPHETEE